MALHAQAWLQKAMTSNKPEAVPSSPVCVCVCVCGVCVCVWILQGQGIRALRAQRSEPHENYAEQACGDVQLSLIELSTRVQWQ